MCVKFCTLGHGVTEVKRGGADSEPSRSPRRRLNVQAAAGLAGVVARRGGARHIGARTFNDLRMAKTAAPLPPNEAARLAALHEYRILDTPPEQAIEDLARLAAQICGTPISLVCFVDAERVWLKARVGFEAHEMPRRESLCAEAILSPHRFLIPDLAADPRYAKHPTVSGPEGFRFYGGVPLVVAGGYALGILCVLDRRPRELTPAQVEGLEILARQVITHLELRRNLRRLERSLDDHERAQAALSLAEMRYRSIFENVAEGIFQTTAEGHYLAANPMLAKIYGYATSEDLRAAVRDIRGQLYVDPNRRDEFIREMQEHGEVRHFESQIHRKDGSVIWISENARSVYDTAGKFLYYEGTVEDISDRKEAEEALRNNELLYHSLVDALPQNIFRKDREGRFTFVNQLFCQTLKRRLDEILGKTDYEFFTRELAERYRADDRRVMETEVGIDQTEEHIRPDLSRIYVHVIKTPLKDASGQVIGVQGIFWDETERHRMEAKLAYERDLLRALLDNVPDAIYFKDRKSRFLRASRSLAQKFGVGDPEKLVGKTDFDFFTTEHAKPAYDDEQRIIATGQPILGVTERETWPDGRETWALTAKLPFRDEAGRIIGTFGVSKDVTDLIRVERELERARDSALDVARLKAQILANMSHEVRTPMNAIIGTADLLRRSPLTPEQREFADQIHHGAETLLNIINGILDLSRLESGHMTLEQIEFDLRDTVESAIELLAESAHHKGLDLVCWIQPEVPSHVRGDPVRLRQVLTNLVGNAIKFTPHGEVNVRLGLARADADRVGLRFEVEDTGVGVAPAAREQIFEPFRQADGSTTRKFGGTGLGLAISRQLVELMGGSIEVTSQVNAGSTFAFTATFGSVPDANGRTPLPAGDPLRGKRVLVVDDHAGSRRVLLQELRWWGVLADEAGGAEEAQASLRAAAAAGRPFECVLLDVSLKETSGLELAVAIKGDPRLPPPRVVLLTSLGQWLDAEAMRANGVSACLIKPPRHSRLFATLLNLRGGSPASATSAPASDKVAALAGGRIFRVMVAEDNDFNRRLAMRQLASLGHSVVTAANGVEVLRLLEHETADVLLLDCQMPEMDGYQTARAIRNLEARNLSGGASRPALYIIALTANALPGDREKCLASGMNDYVTKPVRIADLEAALQRAQGLTPAAQTPSAGSPATAAAPPPAEPPLDLAAVQALGGDPAALQELVDLFLASSEAQIARLKTAGPGEATTMQAAAHSLKGSAVNFSARRLGQLAAELERSAKAGTLTDAPRLVAAVAAEFERVREALKGLPAPRA